MRYAVVLIMYWVGCDQVNLATDHLQFAAHRQGQVPRYTN